MAKEDFKEESVVRSEKQLALDEDAAKFVEYEALRSQLAGVDQSVFTRLFPGFAIPSQPSETGKRKHNNNTNDAIKKPKIDEGVDELIVEELTEDCCDSGCSINPDEELTEDYAASDEPSSSSGSSEGHSS